MDAAGYIRNDVSCVHETRSFHCTRMYNGKKCVIIPSGKPHGDDRGFSHICLLQSLYNFWNKMAGNYPKTVTQSALADIRNFGKQGFNANLLRRSELRYRFGRTVDIKHPHPHHKRNFRNLLPDVSKPDNTKRFPRQLKNLSLPVPIYTRYS